MIFPKFLFDNALKGVTPTFSGTTLAGKPPASCVDWLDFSYFEADSGTLDYTMSADTTIDTFSAFVATFTGTGSETIELQYESAPSVFTSLVTIDPVGGKLTFNEFASVTVLATRKIRIIITVGTGTLLIRQLVVGEALVAEQGQYKTMTYPSLIGGVKVTNNISMNGSILGRSIKREERSGKIDLMHLTPAWVRNTWEPFVRHFARNAFIYAPNTRDYPNDVAFASVDGAISAASNSGPGDLMSVDYKLRNITADEFAV